MSDVSLPDVVKGTAASVALLPGVVSCARISVIVSMFVQALPQL